jgi:hypothetical protein
VGIELMRFAHDLPSSPIISLLSQEALIGLPLLSARN